MANWIHTRACRLLGVSGTGDTEAGKESPEAAAETLSAINAFSLKPLARGDVAIFTLDLCNDQIDHHFSRFPIEELNRINDLVVGRPMCERHDTHGELPRGTFFRSRLWQEENGITSVRPDVYVLRTAGNADFIENIEGGVYRETSIGFAFELPECSVCGKDVRTCDHIPGQTYAGKMCHYVMRGVTEVIEGSVVTSGSQGTAFVAAREKTKNCGLSIADCGLNSEEGKRMFRRSARGVRLRMLGIK